MAQLCPTYAAAYRSGKRPTTYNALITIETLHESSFEQLHCIIATELAYIGRFPLQNKKTTAKSAVDVRVCANNVNSMDQGRLQAPPFN
jgi:hypothetical protein